MADNCLDKTQRLSQPDQRNQTGCHQYQGEDELPEHITIQAVKKSQKGHFNRVYPGLSLAGEARDGKSGRRSK